MSSEIARFTLEGKITLSESWSQILTFIHGQGPSAKSQGLLEAASDSSSSTPILSPGSWCTKPAPCCLGAVEEGCEGRKKEKYKERRKVCKYLKYHPAT